MKFSLIGPVYPFRGGIAHHTYCLAQAFINHGHEINTVSFKSQYPNWLYPGKTDRDTSKKALDRSVRYILSPLNPITWFKTLNMISAELPDLVLFQWWTTFWSPAFFTLLYLLKRKEIPTLCLIHNVMPHEQRIGDQWLVKATLRQSTFFLVHSEREQNRLRMLIPNAQIARHPHPPFYIFKNPKVQPTDAKMQLELSLDQPTILFFGIVRRYKGLHVLLEAMALLKQQGYSIKLLVAGEIWHDKDVYFRFIMDHDLEEIVRLEDRYIPDEEVGLFFSAADLFVAPYIHGTQSGALTIAKSFNLPIVVTSALYEDADKWNQSIVNVVPPGDAEALANGILKTLQEKNAGNARTANHSDESSEWGELVTIISSFISR